MSVEVSIKAPNLKTAQFTLTGTAPYVQNKFSAKAREMMLSKQTSTQRSTAKKAANREAKDIEACFNGAMYVSPEGWHGMPAPAFRNAMISACRIVGFKMTHAKLCVFVEADGFDKDDGTPLVKLKGSDPIQHQAMVRNATGVCDIRIRPMWREWGVDLRVTYDEDIFALADVANLLSRVGAQVGIGEGRPDSKQSAGMGWGLFKIEGKQ